MVGEKKNKSIQFIDSHFKILLIESLFGCKIILMSNSNVKLQNFLVFIKYLKDDMLVFKNDTIKRIIRSFDVEIINNYQDEIKSQINFNIKNSKIIVINQINLFDQNQNIIYSILALEKTLLILDENSFNKFLSNKQLNSVLFIEKIGNISAISKEIINDSTFQGENQKLIKEFMIYETNNTFREIWRSIVPCITGYLIKKAYEKTKKDRFLNQNQDSDKITIYRKDIVDIRTLGFGSFFRVHLIYHLERCELMAFKTQHINDDNAQRLQKRERDNFRKLKHPLLPKFYDSPEGENYLVMEFINGQTLNHIDKLKLNDNEVVTIIFELILIVEYLHSENMIYRDLKPNNIIIDEYKNVVLIDFDRLIENNQNEEHSTDFGSFFIDPNIQSGRFTEKSDIHSLYLIIKYIINDKKMMASNPTLAEKILDLFHSFASTNSDMDEPVLELFFSFVQNFCFMIQLKNLLSISQQICDKHKIPIQLD